MQFRAFSVFITITIVLNSLVLCLYRYSPASHRECSDEDHRQGMSQEEIYIYSSIEDAFLTLFAIEAVLKIIAYGTRYFKHGWDRYTFVKLYHINNGTD